MGALGRARLVLVCVVLAAVVGACTSSSPKHRPSSAGASSGSTSATQPVGGSVELSCADTASANLGGGTGNLAVNGLTLESAAGELRGSPAADAGFRVPSGRALYFVKVPAYLKAGTAAITVELTAPSSGYLAWVPATVWTGGQHPVDLRPWATAKLTFDGCPDRDAAYLGGLLATDPHMCLTVNIRQAGAPLSPPTRLGGTAC